MKFVETSQLVYKGASRVGYHRECLSAEVYFERQVKAKHGSEALLRFKREKPREFKYKVLEVLGGGGRRGASERAKCLELMEEIVYYSRSYTQQYIFMLGERAFKQWCPLCRSALTLAPIHREFWGGRNLWLWRRWGNQGQPCV